MTTVARQLPTQSRRPEIHQTNLAQQSWIMVKRNMIHTKRMPEMLSDVTTQPIMFVLLFAFVFGASITNTGGPSYREFLLPGNPGADHRLRGVRRRGRHHQRHREGRHRPIPVTADRTLVGVDRPQRRQPDPLVDRHRGDGRDRTGHRLAHPW